MERRYTTGVIRSALKGTSGAIAGKESLAHDWEKGIFTAQKYGPGKTGVLGGVVKIAR